MKNLYINFFIYIIIKESSFDIYLFNVLIISNNNNKDNFIVYKFNYRDESFVIVKIFQLFETLYILACFVLNNFFIDVFFATIDLFVNKNFALF